MSVLSGEKLAASLKAGQVDPLYLLIGSESYLRASAVRAITDAALSGTLLREFNESSFSLLSGGARDVMAVANQLPMMSARRVVRITEFSKLREAEEDLLITYLNDPAESSVVIFNTEELDKRKKLTKTLLEKCQTVEFPALKDGEAKFWIKSRLKELKLTCDEQSLNELIALVGTDVQTLSSELDKLASAAVDTRRITVELVDELIGRSRELRNFELGNHLISRNRPRALETLHRLLENGAEPVMLLGLIASNFHRLALAKDALSRGFREDVFRSMPMPPFKRAAFLSELQRTDPNRIAESIKLIAAADLAIKTSLGGGGPKGAQLQLEMLVCELAR
jgi:DNA polymerase III subunit delta